MIWCSHLFKNFPQFNVIHTVKDFGTVNKAEVDVALELSSFFNDPTDIGSWISGSAPISTSSLHIWKFTVHILLNHHLENFEHYFTSMWNECNCAVDWAFFGIAFLWDWNENCPFPVTGHCWVFQGTGQVFISASEGWQSSSMFQLILLVLPLLPSFFVMFERNLSEWMNDGWDNMPCLQIGEVTLASLFNFCLINSTLLN